MPKKHYLMASNFFVSREEYEITTILGSCVSVCLWDSQNHFGGMTHYLLPKWNKTNMPTAMYGDWAIEKLIKELIALGSHIADLKARVYGGAQMFNNSNTVSIGQQNYEMALSLLKLKNIPIIDQDVGGNFGRKIIFNNSKNLLTLKKLNPVI